MKFEKNNVYDFQYAGLADYDGKRYILLTYDGRNSMPGYKTEQWVFRTELLDFQKAWTPEDFRNTIACFVSGFIIDYADGRPTSFPILKQDIKSILEDKYEIGKNYSFPIIAVPGEEIEKEYGKTEVIDYYIVRDQMDFEHYLYTTAVYQKGEIVDLTISDIGGNHLKFADPVRQKIRETFQIGEEYEFEIISEELDALKGLNFFTLRDTLVGFIHRFYFKEAREDGPEDKITLKVKDITPKGWLLLSDPNKSSLTPEDWKQIEIIEEGPYSRENDSLEYKSSFVFTADGEQNIDKQLGKEIMRQIASFMNAQGGTICLGYRDACSICGINNDIQYLNSSKEDEIKYKLSPDGLELKIRSYIREKLGGIANGLTEVKFFKNDREQVVCHLIVKPSVKPVYLNHTHLYKRSGNMCQHLLGDEITFFILERFTQIMQNAQSVINPPPPPPVIPSEKTGGAVEIQTEAEKDQDIPVIPEIPVKEERILQYITLYQNRQVSRQTNKSAEPDVLFNIPFTASCRNRSARLLFCYQSGHVNVLNPGEIVSGKLKTAGRRYANGFNNADTLKAIFVCNADDYLVIRSHKNDGTKMIKALHIKPFSVHDANSMQTPGNKLLDVSNASLDDFEIVRNEEYSFIHPVVVKSRNSNPGILASKWQKVLEFLEKRKNYSAAEEIRN